MSTRAVKIRREVERLRPKSEKIPPLSITRCFENILGDTTRDKKKYKSHLFKVLPQIYTGTYFNDPVLLPALIEKTEFNIRNDLKPDFGLLKFDFEFLTKLLNCEEDRVKEIKNSPSYRLGFLLGEMARPFSGANSPIKSFSKNYVGLLSRRIATLEDTRRLGSDIRQKLEMHQEDIIAKQHYFPRRATHNFFEAASDFPLGNSYNRHHCAFGFFHSYGAIPEKKETDDAGNASTPDTADEEQAAIDLSAAEEA